MVATGLRITVVRSDGSPYSGCWIERPRRDPLHASEATARLHLETHLGRYPLTGEHLASCVFFNGQEDCARYRFRVTEAGSHPLPDPV